MTEPTQRTPLEQIATDVAAIRTSVAIVAGVLVGALAAAVLFWMIQVSG